LTNRLKNFEYKPGTGIQSNSCGVSYQGRLLVFGGGWSNYRKQISEVKECTLQKIGSLNEDFQGGGCNVFEQHGKQYVLLCFSTGVSDDSKSCFRLVNT